MVPGPVSAPEISPSRFAEYIGVEWIDLDPDAAKARIKLEQHHLQPFGVVHGGVYTTLAESLCSAATYDAVKENDLVAFGMSSGASFLRTIAGGHVNALARARQRGRTTWVWDTELSDDEDRLCALVRMTIAVR
jgi:1,4-dihydroxy-2-naphthoyl-CoA hydrolase